MLRERRWLGAQIPLPLEKRLLLLLWQFGLLSQTRWKLRVQITEAVFHECIKRIPKLFHFALQQRHQDTVMFTAPTVYSGTERLFLTILANTSRRATVHRAGRRLDRVPCMCVNPCDFPLLLLLHALTFSESINLTQNRCVKPCALSASSCCFQHAHSSQTTHMHIFLPVLFVNLSCLACLGDKCLNRGMFSLLIM